MRYRYYRSGGPHRLESWIDRHCSECGKFIKKTNRTTVCHVCCLKRIKDGVYTQRHHYHYHYPYVYNPHHAEEMRIWRKNNSERNKQTAKRYRDERRRLDW